MAQPETMQYNSIKTVMAQSSSTDDGTGFGNRRRTHPVATTLVESVMATIRQRIAARSLTPGARLPSIRAFAKAMQVSKSTVVEAYERLAAEGAIRSRPGSGFYAAGSLAPLSLAEIGPRLDRAVDPLWVSRQSLEAGDEMLKPGCGWLPASWMPQAGLRRALRTVARADDVDACRLRHAARPAAAAAVAGAAHGRAWHRRLARTDHADGIGHAGHRSPVPVPDRARRYGAGRRPLLFQFPRAAARPPRQGRQRSLHAVGAGYRAVRAGAGRASAAPLHHQFRHPQSDRRDPVAGHRAPAAEARRPVGPDHRRGRHLRRFRAQRPRPGWRRSMASTASSISAASPRRCRPRFAAASSPRPATGSSN